MDIYISPDNQKLLWNVITTSPLIHNIAEQDVSKWFQNIIEQFFIKSSTTQNITNMNMDTIVYMIRDLRRLSSPVEKEPFRQSLFMGEQMEESGIREVEDRMHSDVLRSYGATESKCGYDATSQRYPLCKTTQKPCVNSGAKLSHRKSECRRTQSDHNPPTLVPQIRKNMTPDRVQSIVSYGSDPLKSNNISSQRNIDSTIQYGTAIYPRMDAGGFAPDAYRLLAEERSSGVKVSQPPFNTEASQPFFHQTSYVHPYSTSERLFSSGQALHQKSEYIPTYNEDVRIMESTNHPFTPELRSYVNENRHTERGWRSGPLESNENNTIVKEPYDGRGTLSLSHSSSAIPKSFSHGALNPLHIPTITKTISVDTRFRDSFYTTTSSNFYINLPSSLRKVLSIQLTSYEIPNTFYGISASYGNNFLYLKCTYQYPVGSVTTSTTIIKVADGNYSVSDLIDNINSQLRPTKDDGSLANVDFTSSTSIFNCIQLSFDVTSSGSGSGKVSIVAEDAPGFDYGSAISSIEMNFLLDVNGNQDTTPLTSKLGWNLGFTKPNYTNATSYISDTLPETSSMRYIYLVVDEFQNNVNNTFIGAFDNLLNYSMTNSAQCSAEKGNVSNILAKIPINGPQFNILFENNLTQYSEPRRYFGPVDIQRMHIQLLDDHGRILDINNVNYSFCLSVILMNE